jgi:hypothetical protein
MKRFLTALVAVFSMTVSAQDMYVAIHYVIVKSSDAQKLIDLEKQYFSKLHKASIDAGQKLGWDMWQLENGSDAQHTTFVYAHLTPEVESLWAGDNSTALFSETELAMASEKWSQLVLKSTFIMTDFKGGFVPAQGETPANYATIHYMNVDPLQYYEYENQELNVWQPYHKQNKLIRGWGLHKILNPVEDGGANYITAQFYTSLGDIYKMSEATGKLSKQEKANYTGILKQRKMSRIDILSLVLSER